MAGHPARFAAGRRGPDEGPWCPRQFGHAGLVSEDRTPAALRGRIDGEHRDTPAECYAVEAKALDEGRFARTRRAGNADADRTPAIWQEHLDEPLGLLAMVGAGRFDQGDGAGERPPIAPPQGRGQLFGGHTLVNPLRARLRAAPPPAG